MNIQNSNQTTSVGEVKVNFSLPKASLNSTEVKTEGVRKQVIELQETVGVNEKTIETLKNQLMQAGIRPNGSIPPCCGIQVSNEPGELGELENKMFALQKQVLHQECFIGSMQRQQAASVIPKKSETDLVRENVEKLQGTVNSNEKTIAALKFQLKEAGKSPAPVVRHGGVRVSMKSGELGKLETKMYALQKTLNEQNFQIKAMQKQLAE